MNGEEEEERHNCGLAAFNSWKRSVDNLIGEVCFLLVIMVELLSNNSKMIEQHHVSLDKRVTMIDKTMLVAKLQDSFSYRTQSVTRNSREQMVCCLKLQTPVQPIHPPRTINIHRCPELMFHKFFLLCRLLRGHTIVGKRDLDVKKSCQCMRKKYKPHPRTPGWYSGKEKRKPHPEKQHTKDLPFSVSHTWMKNKMSDCVNIQVESSKHQNRIIKPVLHSNHRLGK